MVHVKIIDYSQGAYKARILPKGVSVSNLVNSNKQELQYKPVA